MKRKVVYYTNIPLYTRYLRDYVSGNYQNLNLRPI